MFADNAGGELLTITKSHDNNVSRSVGNIYVTYTAKDKEGNFVKCQFKVMVIGMSSFVISTFFVRI